MSPDRFPLCCRLAIVDAAVWTPTYYRRRRDVNAAMDMTY
jgi:hypothetical protein